MDTCFVVVGGKGTFGREGRVEEVEAEDVHEFDEESFEIFGG